MTSDHEQIRMVLARLCQLRDDDRYDEWIELFTPDGTFDYGTGVFRGRDEIKQHVVEHFPAYGKHLCTNSVIHLSHDAAVVVSDFMKLHPAGDGSTACVVAAAGRYDDRFVRTDEGWKLAARRVDILR